jgi:hypothetical protein
MRAVQGNRSTSTITANIRPTRWIQSESDRRVRRRWPVPERKHERSKCPLADSLAARERSWRQVFRMVLVELGDQAIGRGGAESFAFMCSVALRQTAFKLDETRRSLLVSLLSGIRSGRNLSSWVVVAVKCTLCMCVYVWFRLAVLDSYCRHPNNCSNVSDLQDNRRPLEPVNQVYGFLSLFKYHFNVVGVHVVAGCSFHNILTPNPKSNSKSLCARRYYMHTELSIDSLDYPTMSPGVGLMEHWLIHTSRRKAKGIAPTERLELSTLRSR